ncbi:hypothetical protein QJS10_CPB17g01189 [Acorus calamus]|uniref:Uncharacterized protein n=1 Tax=Acorus calamus TaxID=4465 RepID=A0AAV9CRI9_ACOCL|nr:hypothetical protein QJS10_CPB17g01189 [Acorus calamus]
MAGYRSEVGPEEDEKIEELEEKKLVVKSKEGERKKKKEEGEEGVSAGIYRGIKGYWRRRSYERLDGSGRRRRRVQLAKLGGQNRSGGGANSDRRKGRRFWRIRMRPRFRLASPRRILARLRDGYVKMMMAFANSRVFGGGGISFYGGGGGDFPGFGRPALKEYDEKVILQIYKSLVAQGQLLAREGAIVAANPIAVNRY